MLRNLYLKKVLAVFGVGTVLIWVGSIIEHHNEIGYCKLSNYNLHNNENERLEKNMKKLELRRNS